PPGSLGASAPEPLSGFGLCFRRRDNGLTGTLVLLQIHKGNHKSKPPKTRRLPAQTQRPPPLKPNPAPPNPPLLPPHPRRIPHPPYREPPLLFLQGGSKIHFRPRL